MKGGEIRITITIKSRRSRISMVHGPNLRPMLEVFPLHEPRVLKALGLELGYWVRELIDLPSSEALSEALSNRNGSTMAFHRPRDGMDASAPAREFNGFTRAFNSWVEQRFADRRKSFRQSFRRRNGEGASEMCKLKAWRPPPFERTHASFRPFCDPSRDLHTPKTPFHCCDGSRCTRYNRASPQVHPYSQR